VEFWPGLPPCPYHSSEEPDPNWTLPALPPAAPPPPPAPPPPSQPGSPAGALALKYWFELLPVLPPHMVKTAVPCCPWVEGAGSGLGLWMVGLEVQLVVHPAGMP
jgi:hypothetical protein